LSRLTAESARAALPSQNLFWREKVGQSILMAGKKKGNNNIHINVIYFMLRGINGNTHITMHAILRIPERQKQKW